MTCPRCGAELAAPGVWSNEYQCVEHGVVVPVRGPAGQTPEALWAAVGSSGVPVWAPWPLPPGWLITGIRLAGDAREPARAAVLAASGPAPLGGAADLLLVSEEPGVGWGARLAGVSGLDPGAGLADRPAATKVAIDGHECAMWEVDGPQERSVFVGEADARWLWAIGWPETSGLLLHDHLQLVDLRGTDFDLPVGAISPRLAG